MPQFLFYKMFSTLLLIFVQLTYYYKTKLKCKAERISKSVFTITSKYSSTGENFIVHREPTRSREGQTILYLYCRINFHVLFTRYLFLLIPRTSRFRLDWQRGLRNFSHNSMPIISIHMPSYMHTTCSM